MFSYNINSMKKQRKKKNFGIKSSKFIEVNNDFIPENINLTLWLFVL